MKTPKRRVPGVFQWIRTARDTINRETEGMTPDEWCAYMHTRAEAVRKNRIQLTPEEADRELSTILYDEKVSPSSPKVKATRSRRGGSATKPARQRKTAKQLTYA